MLRRLAIGLVLAGIIFPTGALAQQTLEQQLKFCHDLYQVVITVRTAAETQAAQLKGERDTLIAERDALKAKLVAKEEPKKEMSTVKGGETDAGIDRTP